MPTDTSNTPLHRSSDLLWGVLFIGLGLFRFYQIISGTQMSKLKIFMAVAVTVWGVFKIYAYFKTRRFQSIE